MVGTAMIEAAVKELPRDCVHIKTKANTLTRSKEGRVTPSMNEKERSFDHVIQQRMETKLFELLNKTATHKRRSTLSDFKTNKHVAILDLDLSFLPMRRVAWSVRNYVSESPFPVLSSIKTGPKVCLTYWMNLLQHIPEKKFGDVLVTLEPLFPLDPWLVQSIWEYSPPLYNAKAFESQACLPLIQNKRALAIVKRDRIRIA